MQTNGIAAYSILVFSSLAIVAPAVAVTMPTLTVGTSTGAAGTQVSLPIGFDPGPASVASLQFDLVLPPVLSTVTYTTGSIVTAAGKSIATSWLDGNTWRFLIFGFNSTTIAAGDLLTAQILIANGTASGTINLSLSNITYSDPNGNAIPGTSVPGSVTVSGPTLPVLTLQKSASSLTAVSGDTETFTISYQNTGTADALNSVVTDVVPAGTTFVAGSIIGGGTRSGSTITWNLGTVAANASGSVSFKAKIN